MKQQKVKNVRSLVIGFFLLCFFFYFARNEIGQEPVFLVLANEGELEESEISKILGVKEVCICQEPDYEHEGFYKPVSFIVPQEGYNPDSVLDNIVNFCNSKFPEYARPQKIFIREYLPLTKVGKTDVKKLESEVLNDLSLVRTRN